MDAFGKIDGAFTLEVLKVAPMPSDIVSLNAEGLKSLWHEAKLRRRGCSRAGVIVDYAKKSVGLTGGTDDGRESIKWFIEQIIQLDEQLAEIEMGDISRFDDVKELHHQKSGRNLQRYRVH